MKTLTIRLPDSLFREIERESQSRRLTKSDVVRERLTEACRATELSGSTNEFIADILKESWEATIPAGPPRFRSKKKQKIAEMIRAKKLHR
jgi:hypothetical protein